MRIIAGIAKGRRIAAPPGQGTRPLPDRVREALFSSLGDVGGARVLDLYAGSGSIGLEALSRGAADVVFVEKNRRANEVIAANIEAVGLGGRVVARDVAAFVATDHGEYDLVFVDPPYSVELPSVEAELAAIAALLAPDGIIVVHRRFGDRSPVAPGLEIADRRRYGDSELFRFRNGQTTEEDRVITALVPGSFDPPTNGHIDVIGRCAGIFDKVVVAVIENPSKSELFTTQERLDMLAESCSTWENVEFASFAGLLVDFAGSANVDVIVKGLRAITDFDYEIQMAQMNRHLSGIMTLFVATKPEFGYLSSSLVKEVGRYGGSIDALVPENVAIALKERFND